MSKEKDFEPKYSRNELRDKFKTEFKNLRSLKKQISKVKKMNLPDDKKEMILELLKLWWNLSETNLDSEGFDWKSAEGIGLCISMIILEHENQNKDKKEVLPKVDPTKVTKTIEGT